MRTRDMFFAISVAILWGGNFVASKYAVTSIPPFLLTSLRFIILSFLLLPFVKPPTRAQIRCLLPIAVMSTAHFSLLLVALYLGLHISAGAVVGQLGVPFACLLGAIFLNDKLGPWRIAGIVIAFIGIMIVAGTPNILEHPNAFLVALGSTFTWGTANILVKRVNGFGHMQLLGWTGVLTVPMLLFLSYFFEFNRWPEVLQAPPIAWVSLGYTVICSTVIAYGLWYYLLSRYNVSQVTPFSLLTPAFGIAFGEMFFHEGLTWQVLLGGAITIAGVAIVVIRRPKTLILGEAV